MPVWGALGLGRPRNQTGTVVYRLNTLSRVTVANLFATAVF